jgi:thiol-disulfide isomerase/thioredoxin
MIKKKKSNKNYLYKNFYGENTNIIELKLKDFIYQDKNLYIKKNIFPNNKIIIIFYAPWCTYCKKISELMKDLALNNINLFYFGAVNYENIEDKNDVLCNYANISKLPTIKILNKDGQLIDYKYEYTIDNLIYFINTNI